MIYDIYTILYIIYGSCNALSKHVMGNLRSSSQKTLSATIISLKKRYYRQKLSTYHRTHYQDRNYRY